MSELFRKNRSMVLGGGSNVLLTADYDGLVIKNEIRGITVVREDGTLVYPATPQADLFGLIP